MIKKTLDQWLSYLESIHPSEIELGLTRIREVAESMGLLKPANKILVVAGTNGKGSTVTYCDSILRAAGKTVGCYMSPHLHVYNERVRINGKNVSDEDLVESFEEIDSARGGITLTYFEVGTLSALYLFKKYQVDVAVLEVGLGGRLDAVNIVDADVSVVTSVGLDHQDWLGDDVSVIATEKAGVYRSNRPAVCGQEDAPQSLLDYAQSISAPLYKKDRDFSFIKDGEFWVWQGRSLDGTNRTIKKIPNPKLPLVNLPTAIQTLLLLEPSLSDESIIVGLTAAALNGRMETFSSPFNGLMDVGHNAQAAQLLAARLQAEPCKGKRRVLLAMLDDKDPAAVVSALDGVVSEWHLAGLSGYRGQTVESLQNKVVGQIGEVACHESVSDGLECLKSLSTDEDEVIILGSFVTVAQAQDWLRK
jgi:dihydrofolate synthase/folylpolyglutamate synthase